MSAPPDSTRDFDMIVVGGGPNGAVAAALLACCSGLEPGRIALIAPEFTRTTRAAPEQSRQERRPGQSPDMRQPAPVRVAALSRASEMVLHNARAWDRLPGERLCAYQRMRVWHESVPADGPEVLQFAAAEVAEPNLGYIVENRALAAAGVASFTEQGGQILGGRVEGLEVGGDAAHLRTDAGTISARLVVGADGANSRVRELLGIALRTHDYRQSAIVATIASARSHQHTAWQRFLGSGPLALLPLADGCSSIVWSAEQSLAEELMQLTAEQFARRLDAASDGVLGATRLVSERVSFALQRATAESMVAPRAALIGDAAHVLHPLAGQGMNLGFLDAAALCESVAEGIGEREEVGAARFLRSYEQRRLTHDALMSWSMSAFNELFSRSAGPAGWLAARLLGVAGASSIVRRGFARRALGLSGEVPALARHLRRAAQSKVATC
jgi:ubiquinone biosynthesis UbiH/UbiF/VisC/COQ6 family hydroxylase